MKIGLDISPLYTEHVARGVGTYTQQLQNALVKYYQENTYVFLKAGNSYNGNLDIIHYPFFDPFFLTLPWIKKTKTVVTVHDLIPLVFPEHFPAGLSGKLRWQIQKTLLRKVDAIITDSMCSKKDIVKYIGISEKKIHVVYLAASEAFKKVENTLILGSIRKKYNLPDKFVLYVGDVTWNKNLPRLIEAIKKIDVPFVMVGKVLISKDFDRKNPWNRDLVKVQELASDNKRIIRLGFVPIDDLVILYNMATVFAMPSLYEGFGLPILEAMSCGCPVVTSKKGSLLEVAGSAALFVDPYDVKSIASGIERIFTDPVLRKKMSFDGKERVKKFSWQKTAFKTVTIYEKVFKR